MGKLITPLVDLGPAQVDAIALLENVEKEDRLVPAFAEI